VYYQIGTWLRAHDTNDNDFKQSCTHTTLNARKAHEARHRAAPPLGVIERTW
jgi:hypothetical protein